MVEKLSVFIEQLNNYLHDRLRKASWNWRTPLDSARTITEARKRARLIKGENNITELKNDVRTRHQRLGAAGLAFIDSLIETMDDMEVSVSLDLHVFERLDRRRRLVAAAFSDINVFESFDSGIASLETLLDKVQGCRNVERKYFVLEFSMVDESGLFATQPAPEVVQSLLTMFTELLFVHCASFKVQQISRVLNPFSLEEDTLVVNNFDEFGTDEEEYGTATAILNHVRQLRELGPARVIDNIKKVNITDEKKNIILFGLTKTRKSGTANDIIKIIDPSAPDKVFVEKYVLSLTNRISYFEVNDVRVWDTPGLDDQHGRGEVFLRKLHRLMDSLPQISAIYLCLKQSDQLRPKAMDPIKDIVRCLPKSARKRISILLTSTERVDDSDFDAVSLNAEHAGLENDVQFVQATRNASDHSLKERVKQDLEKKSIPFGYAQKAFEAFKELEEREINSKTIVKYQVEKSMQKLEEKIVVASKLKSTKGVLWSLRRHRVWLRAYDKPVLLGEVPRANIELEVSILLENSFGLLDVWIDRFVGPGNWGTLRTLLAQEGLVLLDYVKEINAWNNVPHYSMALIPLKELMNKQLFKSKVESACLRSSFGCGEETGEGAKEDA